MRKISFLSLLFIIVSCKSKKVTADSPEKFQMEKLVEVISDNDLQKIYPEAQMTEGVDLFEEGTVERPYSVLYPNTKDEILIIWADTGRKNVQQIYYENNGRWSSEKGIRIGTTYDELVEFNEGPIDVYGFGWDYSGAVDWKDGKMADTNVRVFLAPENAPPKSFYGDQIIDSSLVEDLRNLNLKVRAIIYQKEF